LRAGAEEPEVEKETLLEKETPLEKAKVRVSETEIRTAMAIEAETLWGKR
jgi:hypothetical protein